MGWFSNREIVFANYFCHIWTISSFCVMQISCCDIVFLPPDQMNIHGRDQGNCLWRLLGKEKKVAMVYLAS